VPAYLSESNECGLLRSTDDGISWAKVSVLSNYYVINGIAEGTSGHIVAGSYVGDIYLSTDDGDTWTKVASSPFQPELRCIASDRIGNYYAVEDTSVLVSNDGIRWSAVPTKSNYGAWQSIVVDNQGSVFLGSDNGVSLSSDQGRTWNLMNDGLYDRYVMCMKADDSGNVVLGTGSGVYRLADSVDSWHWFGSGFPVTFTTAITISPDGYVYAGTQSYGLYRTVSRLQARIPVPESPSGTKPLQFSLFQNYPNPFNSTTLVRYQLPVVSQVSLVVFDILGREVSMLVNETKAPGSYEVRFDGADLASGVYFYRLQAGDYVATRKLLLLR